MLGIVGWVLHSTVFLQIWICVPFVTKFQGCVVIKLCYIRKIMYINHVTVPQVLSSPVLHNIMQLPLHNL